MDQLALTALVSAFRSMTEQLDELSARVDSALLDRAVSTQPPVTTAQHFAIGTPGKQADRDFNIYIDEIEKHGSELATHDV